MKTFWATTAILLIFITVPALYFFSITSNIVRFLQWRLTSDIAVASGDVVSRQTKIHYTVYGEGTPILLLHGGLSNKLSWFSQLPELSNCGYQLILLDSRGHGRSGLGNHELSYRLLAEDAIAVLDRLKIQQVDLLGWSDGANTALLMASDWPERINKIVAISGNYHPQGLTKQARQENLEKTTGIKYWLYRVWTGAEENFHELEKRLKTLWKTGPVVSDAALAKIKSPTLLIVGERDVVMVEHAQDMAKKLPNSTLYIVRHGGHSSLITDAAEVNSQIEKFLICA